MLDHGHPVDEVYDYCIARIWDEAEFVVERQNRNLVNLAVIIQQATSTTGMTASKETAKSFQDFIKKLNGDS